MKLLMLHVDGSCGGIDRSSVVQMSKLDSAATTDVEAGMAASPEKIDGADARDRAPNAAGKSTSQRQDAHSTVGVAAEDDDVCPVHNPVHSTTQMAVALSPKVATAASSKELFGDVDLSLSMRDWILKLIPDINGPTLHALTEEFRKEGILLLEDVRECMQSEALEMNDIKRFLSAAKLPMKKQAFVLRSLKALHLQ
jgi:hypothetical protein